MDSLEVWVDSKTAVAITEGRVKGGEAAYGLEDDRLWIGDNLHAQCTPEFKAATGKFCGVVRHYPPKTSDKGCAPVDNGAGAAIKAKVGEY